MDFILYLNTNGGIEGLKKEATKPFIKGNL